VGELEIRDLAGEDEIAFAASRMRSTLVEVLGVERGVSMYSLNWLRERARFHMGPERIAKVLVEHGMIVGHALARVDSPDDTQFGLFSTIYVAPDYRGRGAATKLIEHVEDWFAGLGIEHVVYNTGAHHELVIGMFERRGYFITARADERVALTKIIQRTKQ